MSEPYTGDELSPASPGKRVTRSRYGFRGRKSTIEASAAVERPSRVVFQASPSTIGALSVWNAGEPGERVLVWGPGTKTRQRGEADEAAHEPPVFVIASDAADRDFVRQLLAGHPDLTVAPECGLLAELVASVRENQGRLVYLGLPEQYWYKHAAEQFASLEAREAAAQGKRRTIVLVDPTQIALEVLDRMFPTSLVVHLVGDGPGRRARALRSQAGRVSAGRYLEVRAHDVRSDPEAIKRTLLGFLGQGSSTAHRARSI